MTFQESPQEGQERRGASGGDMTADVLRRDFDILRSHGLHPFPVGGNKLPIGQWSKGDVNYVTTAPDDADRERWVADPRTRGWAVLCGNRNTRVFTLDVEAEGMDHPQISGVFEPLPASCQRPSPSGGRHAVVITSDGEPVATERLATIGPPEARVLLAELRGVSRSETKAGAYAMITGPGRGPLQPDFAPAVMTAAEVDQLLAPIRALNEPTEREQRTRANKARTSSTTSTSSNSGSGGGTGSVIADAVLSGELTWPDVLEPGWTIVSDDGERLGLLRPGSPKSEESGNAIGAVLAIHSSAVEWAESGETFNPPQALAASVFDGDFAAAMTAAENDQTGWPFAEWPPELLERIARRAKESRRKWLEAQAPLPPAAAEVADEYGRTDLTDGALRSVALGRRMARTWAGRFIFVPQIGWHEWDGARWRETETETMLAIVATWAEDFIHELVARQPPVAREVINSALKYRDVGNVAALLNGAKTAPAILVRAERLDQHPTLLNCPNGVVDLTTGEIRPSDPDLLITKVTAVDYVAGFTSPDWEMALQSLADDPRAFMQRRLGQSLYGYPPPDDELILCDGGGQNGKTSILGTVRTTVGDYGVLVSERILLGSVDQHPTEFMDFRGARFAYMEETPEARRLDVTRLKRIVGTPTIKARRMHKDSVEFPVTHTMFISTNYRPTVDEVDHGTWRRLLRVFFPYTFRKRAQEVVGPRDRLGEDGLRHRLSMKGSDGQKAALAWMVQGAVEHHRAGGRFPELPTEVAEATQEWRREADQILAYTIDRLVVDPESCVLASELLGNFNEWLAGNHHKAWASTTFATRFGGHGQASTHGIEKRETRDLSGLSRAPVASWAEVAKVPKRATVWLGIRFRTDADDQGGEGGEGATQTPLREASEKVSDPPSPPSPPSRQEGDDDPAEEAKLPCGCGHPDGDAEHDCPDDGGTS